MSNKIFVTIVAVIIAVSAVTYIVIAPGKSASNSKIHAAQGSLASLNTGTAPWAPEYAQLSNRLLAIHTPLLSTEGTALHIHTHLDIYIQGQHITVPADIGIPPSGGITPVHTHDTTGIIHIESPDAHAVYTLGQFFDIWGVKLTATSIGGYLNDATNSMTVYDNGQKVADPPNVALAAHHEVVITYGTSSEQLTIPSHYNFPSGL